MNRTLRPPALLPGMLLPLLAAALVLVGSGEAGRSLTRHIFILQSQVELVAPPRLDPAPSGPRKLVSPRTVIAGVDRPPHATRAILLATGEHLVQTRLVAYLTVHRLFVHPRRLLRRAALRRLPPDDDIPLG